MYLRALHGKVVALGRNDMSTLKTVSNLGNLYWRQGKLKQAEAMYKRAGESCELMHSRVEHDVNMGNLYAEQDCKQKALTMYSTALSGLAALRGRSSDVCRGIDRRLKVLTDNAERETNIKAFHSLTELMFFLKSYIREVIR
jgi:tetratricopeptide (TPR) repeat protein